MSQAQAFLNLYLNNPSSYYRQRDNGSYYRVDELITLDLLKEHFLGNLTLCLPAIYQNQCKWVCWDDDTPDGILLNKMVTFCHQLGLNPLREGARPGRAGHLWLLLDQPLYSETAYNFGILSKSLFGIAKKELEFFPKQKVIGIDGVGNGVRLPLGINRKTLPDKPWALFQDCPDQNVAQQVRWLTAQPLSSTERIIRYLDSMPPVTGAPIPRKKAANIDGNLLDLIPAGFKLHERSAGRWQTQCPLCKEEGHDDQANNLSIDDGGKLMYCHYNQGAHNFVEIIRAFRRLQPNRSNQQIDERLQRADQRNQQFAET